MKTHALSFLWIVASMCAVSAPLFAADGVSIVAKETNARGSVSTTTDIRIERTRLRLDTTTRGTHVGDLLFDAQQRRILFVTNITKTLQRIVRLRRRGVSQGVARTRPTTDAGREYRVSSGRHRHRRHVDVHEIRPLRKHA